MPSSAPTRPSGYRLRRLTLASALSATLSGCYTLAGAPMIDLAILGAGVAAMGVGSAAMDASAPAAQVRQAQIDHTGEANPGPAQARDYHARLRALHTGENGLLAADSFEVPPGAGGGCELSATATAHLLTQGGFADPGRDVVDNGNVRETLHSMDATLIEGDCHVERPEGPFIALVSYTETLLMREVGVETDTRYRIRIEGDMKAGALDGEVLQLLESTSNSRNLNNPDFQAPEQSGHASRLGMYDNGQPVGYHVNYTNNYGIARTIVRGFLDEEYANLTTWIGGTRFSSGYMNRESGELDGWLRYTAPGINGSRECFRDGELTMQAGYCADIDRQLEGLTPLAKDGEFTRGSASRYL